MPTINGYSIVPIYGIPAKDAIEVELRVLDLNRILARQVYEEVELAYANKIVTREDMRKAESRRLGSCVLYLSNFVTNIVLNRIEVSPYTTKTTRLLAQSAANVAMAKMMDHPDGLVGYIAKYGKFDLLFRENKIELVWKDIEDKAPRCEEV